jgi:hypothetical protein
MANHSQQLRVFLFLFLATCFAFGQGGTATHVRSVTSLPALCNPGGGAGGTPMDYVSLWNGSVATPEYCSALNTWTAFGAGTGNGTVNNGTATHLPIYNTSTNAVSNNPRLTDNGSTLAYTGGTVSATTFSGNATSATNSSQLVGNTWAAPGPIGGTTPSPGTFSAVTIVGPSPYYDTAANGISATSHTLSGTEMTSLNNLLSGCNGGTVVFTGPQGTVYGIPGTNPMLVTAPCTITSSVGITIQKAANAQASNNYTAPGPGYVIVSASNVSLKGTGGQAPTFDCNYQSFTGACVTFRGNITNDVVDGAGIINCDGPCLLTTGAAAGGAAPYNFTLRNSVLITGVNSGTTGAGGPISARDGFSNHNYLFNYVDAHLDGYGGSAAFELECGNSTAATATIACTHILVQGNYAISSCNSNNAMGGGGWVVQSGAFSALPMTGLRIVDNSFHLWCDSNGFVSVPSTKGTVVEGNHEDTHFADPALIATGSNGATTGTVDTFTDATYNAFLGSGFGNAAGRTLAYLCGGVWYFTGITSQSSSSVIVPVTTPTCSGSGEQWTLFGYSVSFAANELGNSTGPTFNGNTIYAEGSENSAAVWCDGTSGYVISSNLIFGFGNNMLGTGGGGSAGIGCNTGYAATTVSSVSQTGFLATVNTAGSYPGTLQTGMKVMLCDTGLTLVTAGCLPHVANGITYGTYDVYEVPLNSGTSIIIRYPMVNTGAQPVTLCSGSCAAQVIIPSLNGQISNNYIQFPDTVPTFCTSASCSPTFNATMVGIQAKAGNATSVVASLDSRGNTIVGSNATSSGTVRTPPPNQIGFSIQSASASADMDSITSQNDTFVNIDTGFNVGSGSTLTGINKLFNPTFKNVTTRVAGVVAGLQQVTFFPNLTGTCTSTFSATPGIYSLYGTGPNITATTCAAQTTSLGAGMVMTQAGTLAGLNVTATAAGGASAVVTVYKNGGATTITCSMNGVTACADVSHNVAYAQGDLISIAATVGTSDTLAGVKAVVGIF